MQNGHNTLNPFLIAFERNGESLGSPTPALVPFVRSTFYVGGWRNALRVLRGRYTVEIQIDGPPELVEAVRRLCREYSESHRNSGESVP